MTMTKNGVSLLIDAMSYQYLLGAEIDYKEDLQGAQFVARLYRQHYNWQIRIGNVGLEAFHHLEAIHAGHLQVEQDNVVAVKPMQYADFHRIHGRTYLGIAGFAEQLLKQSDIRFLVVDDQDTGLENFCWTQHACVLL